MTGNTPFSQKNKNTGMGLWDCFEPQTSSELGEQLTLTRLGKEIQRSDPDIKSLRGVNAKRAWAKGALIEQLVTDGQGRQAYLICSLQPGTIMSYPKADNRNTC